MRVKRDTPDAVIEAIASRQHGVVSFRQLIDAGIDRRVVIRRADSRRLIRIHRGVYAVGHGGVSEDARRMAAVLACGDGAVLSFASAAALWGMLPARHGPMHVSVPSRAGRRARDDIALHRCPSLTVEQTGRRSGIPVTRPARTLADLRRTERADVVRRAMREAEVLGLPLPGIPSDGTRSELEAMFLRLCRRHGLPAPEVNVGVDGLLVDFLWREARLVVETDGYRFHRGRVAFEEDRDRDLRLRALGYDVLRFTYRQVAEQPARVASAVGAAL